MLLNILEVIAWIVIMGRFIYLERENRLLKEMCESYNVSINAFLKDIQKIIEQDDEKEEVKE